MPDDALPPMISLLPLPSFPDVNGVLVVTSAQARPFDIARAFTIHADAGMVRGQHAHRSCSQFLVCVAGSFRISVSNGVLNSEVNLDSPDAGLLIPPHIWASEQATSDGSVLLVLCDMEYDEVEYIREYEEFLALVGVNAK